MITTEIVWQDPGSYKPHPEASILFIDDCGNAHRVFIPVIKL